MGERSRISIICKGRVPGTSVRCGEQLLDSDGESFFILTTGGELQLQLDPPRITCPRCGYRTVLNARSKKRLHSGSV
jgi:DNA-directed RNA polymerase subunit RPC12/RpoP